MFTGIVQVFKRRFLWRLLLRSPVHSLSRQNRVNTIYSLLLAIAIFPIAVLFSPFFAIRVLLFGRIDLYELRIQGEFAWFVESLERIRGSRLGNTSRFVVIVRSTFQHSGLAHLYRTQLGCVLLWSSGISVLLAQLLLLQPTFLVRKTVLSGENYFSLDMAVEPLAPSRRLARLREKTLSDLGCSQTRYVTMAVFTSTKEEQADPLYASRTLPRETVGADLAESVDFLRAKGVDVIMLGFPDSGKAHVPREMPRLSDFAKVGGLHEVALASGCLYFWADCVGAGLLRQPFKRAGLVTNVDERLIGPNRYPQLVLEKYLVTLLRYQTPGGHLLTLREMFSYGQRISREHSSCFAAVARGELKVIRNSPTDYVDAHREMMSRLDGSWNLDDRMGLIQDRLDSLHCEFPDLPKVPIALNYLARHTYLLE